MSIADDLREELVPEFERNFTERGEIGASVSVFYQGAELLNLSQGIARVAEQTPWTAETIVPVWSATKGPAAVACLHAMQAKGVWLDDLVKDVWPGFAQAGKEQVTFGQLLSHNAGLSALDETVQVDDFDAVIRAIEKQTPAAEPGTQQAYHARTFGFLLDQIVRLLTDAPSLGHYFYETFGRPMELDFWIGLPLHQQPRVAHVQPAKIRIGTQPDAFQKAYSSTGSLTQRTFTSLAGMTSVRDINKPEIQQLGVASFGGVGSARGLAMFYGMLAEGGTWNGQTLAAPVIVETLQTTLSQQVDAVLQSPIAFSAGVMRDPVDDSGAKLRHIYGSGVKAFGHPGAGGSLAFCDPARQLSFAYVMNQMEPGALPNDKALSLVRAVDRVIV